MNIGYDAKRAFHNATGLGNYSRLLISSFAHNYPGNRYFLFGKNPPGLFTTISDNIKLVAPETAVDKIFASYWRSIRIKKQIRKNAIDIYHGLSAELPVRIDQLKIKTVVTVHDLIYERYPHQYNRIDVMTYRAKALSACKQASRIIAASEQTKSDIISYYKIKEDRVTVGYQACNPAFSEKVSEGEKQIIRQKYNLPARFFLSVGSVIERKNLLAACKAIKLIANETDIPLVVIGNGKSYRKKLEEYIMQNGLKDRIIFLSDTIIPGERNFRNGDDLPAIYQSATALIYTSVFEGFGIPILEALCSGLPVIVSNISCMPEVAGAAGYYIDPRSPAEIANAMKDILTDSALAESMRMKGWQQASQFTPEKCAASVMDIYDTI